jgi:UDP-N-acetylmuramoyl-L-alanyl-D-glutamate--2,6-diaminopimelate ligase
MILFLSYVSTFVNLFKMTMPGRFFIQKFLGEAVNKKCDFAVIEMTSEGTKQFRHKFIDLDALIFTNLAPEHLESHGGYEKYRDAKLKIAQALENSNKELRFMIGNADDKETPKFFENSRSAKAISYSLETAKPWAVLENGVEFTFNGQKITSPLRGKFNIYNALAVATTANVFGVKTETIKSGLEKISEIPGRVESIKTKTGFEVIVDYAHTPDSLEALYEAFQNDKKICILGNTGGGRDTWKRPEMGRIANKYCDKIILTNEDPYDENPKKIIEEMSLGINHQKLIIEMDRRKAIEKSLMEAKREYQQVSIANKKVVVLITGKGTDPYIMEANGKKTPWSDKKVAEEEIKKLEI